MTDRRECPQCAFPNDQDDFLVCENCGDLMCTDCFEDHIYEEVQSRNITFDEFMELKNEE